ncbi:MAG: TlpA family protein disulfide reductase [Bacilli bacterium]|nr:TlpA family protein disulfide reductase [Bacilli bacterium]
MIEYFKTKKADELKEEKAVEEKTVVIEASESPKKKTKAKKVITWSIVVTCAAVLAGVSCYAALSQNKTRFALNDICNDFSYVDVKGNRYDISTDSSAKIVYFFSSQEDQYLEKLNGYASTYVGKLTVTAVSNYALKDTLPSFVESHYPSSLIRFTSDTLNGDLINRFSVAKEEKYSLTFAKNNKVVLSNVGPISDQDFNDVVLPAISGAKIGNEVGDLCLSQDVKLINGEEGYWSVNANRGKVSIINFWGTWCGPCLDELPSFREVYEEHKEEGLEFIAIHQKGYSEEEVNSFIKSDPRLNVFTSHFGLDDENNEYYAALGGKAAWPMTLIVGKDGIISAKHQGEISKETLESEVVAALNK